MEQHRRSGYTLIELSIIFTIIALIVAGILVGKDMMESAKTRSVAKDINFYKSAINSFELKYNGQPGDLNVAQDYWISTTNGNGNTIVEWSAEAYNAWRHLALSGLIPGNYIGAPSSTPGREIEIGVNVPASSSGKTMGYLYGDLHTELWGEVKRNHMQLGGEGDNLLEGGALTAPQSRALDQKWDDGLPDTGNLRARNGSETALSGAPACINTAPAPDTYSEDDIALCNLHFFDF